jgi:hypothetical protein
MTKTNDAPRSRIKQKVARLSEAECSEVLEYIEIMQSLRHEASRRDLFGERFAYARAVIGDDESLLTGRRQIPAR